MQKGLFSSPERPSPHSYICFVFPSTRHFKLEFSFVSRKSNSFAPMLTSGTDNKGIASLLALSCAVGRDTNALHWPCANRTMGPQDVNSTSCNLKKTKYPPMDREPTKRTGFILNQSPNTAINNSTFFAHLHQCYITFKVKTPSST